MRYRRLPLGRAAPKPTSIRQPAARQVHALSSFVSDDARVQREEVTPTCWHISRSGQVEHFGLTPVQTCFQAGRFVSIPVEDHIRIHRTDSMRELALRGEPYTPGERGALLHYCQSDVDSLVKLLPAMLPRIDLPRSLLRGRYMTAVARMEGVGVPIDTETLTLFKDNWPTILARLIERIDGGYRVYDGRTFKSDRWAAWLAAKGIPWPRLPSGELALDDDTCREAARTYPAVAPIRELRSRLF